MDDAGSWPAACSERSLRSARSPPDKPVSPGRREESSEIQLLRPIDPIFGTGRGASPAGSRAPTGGRQGDLVPGAASAGPGFPAGARDCRTGLLDTVARAVLAVAAGLARRLSTP